MPLNEMLVNGDRTAAGGQTKYKWSLSSGIECLDTLCAWTLTTCPMRKGATGVCTNDVVRNVFGRSLGVVANDEPPITGKRTFEYRWALA